MPAFACCHVQDKESCGKTQGFFILPLPHELPVLEDGARIALAVEVVRLTRLGCTVGLNQKEAVVLCALSGVFEPKQLIGYEILGDTFHRNRKLEQGLVPGEDLVLEDEPDVFCL